MSRAVCALTPGNSTTRPSEPDRWTSDSETPNGLIRFSITCFAAFRPSSICAGVRFVPEASACSLMREPPWRSSPNVMPRQFVAGFFVPVSPWLVSFAWHGSLSGPSVPGSPFPEGSGIKSGR